LLGSAYCDCASHRREGRCARASICYTHPAFQRPCFFQEREHPHALNVRSLGIHVYCGCREAFFQIALMSLLAKTYLTTV
jgi:hypothetical protein